ncbi:unnamed protein product [Sympodiomycopsis kandeliae]
MFSNLPREVIDLIFERVVATYPEPAREIFLINKFDGIINEACIRSDASCATRSGVVTDDDLVSLEDRGRLWHPSNSQEPLRVWAQVNRRFRHLALPHIFGHIAVQRHPNYHDAAAKPIWTGPYQGVEEYADHPFRQLRALHATFSSHLHHVRSFVFHNQIPELEFASMEHEDFFLEAAASEGQDPAHGSEDWHEYVELLVWLLAPNGPLKNARSLIMGSHMMCCSAVRAALLARDPAHYISIDVGLARWDDVDFYAPFMSRFERFCFTQIRGIGNGFEVAFLQALCSPNNAGLKRLIIDFDIREVSELLEAPEWVAQVLAACARIDLKVMLYPVDLKCDPEAAALSFSLGNLHWALKDVIMANQRAVTEAEVNCVAKSKDMEPIAKYLSSHASEVAAAFNAAIIQQ